MERGESEKKPHPLPLSKWRGEKARDGCGLWLLLVDAMGSANPERKPKRAIDKTYPAPERKNPADAEGIGREMVW